VFWSPDSKWIAYTSEGMLRRVPASGGSPFVICAIPATGAILSGAWLADGTIAFAVWRENLYTVSASGGTPSRMLAVNPASEVDFHHVAPLPDGRLIIATHRRTDGLTQQEILDGTRRTILTEDGTIADVRPTSAGLLLFLRAGANRGLWAAPSATGPLDLSKAVLVQADAEAYSAANDGTLLIRVCAAIKSSLAWAEPSGRITRIPGDPVQLAGGSRLALSPDGRRAAFIVNARNALNLVVRDLQTGADTPFTFNRPTDVKGTWRLSDPAWFPGGDRLVYASGGVETASRIFEQRLDPGAPPRELTQGIWAAVFRDGRSLFTVEDVRARGKLSSIAWVNFANSIQLSRVDPMTALRLE
jgi:Tol biopolymer transport system component